MIVSVLDVEGLEFTDHVDPAAAVRTPLIEESAPPAGAPRSYATQAILAVPEVMVDPHVMVSVVVDAAVAIHPPPVQSCRMWWRFLQSANKCSRCQSARSA